jgi:hypothetical protein
MRFGGGRVPTPAQNGAKRTSEARDGRYGHFASARPSQGFVLTPSPGRGAGKPPAAGGAKGAPLAGREADRIHFFSRLYFFFSRLYFLLIIEQGHANEKRQKVRKKIKDEERKEINDPPRIRA